ncbi:phage tail protein [Lysinibacillus sp. ZYM-1]|uniref:phage tail protein n=1 Tax=Lysinibacillus sp. ZYM-1 TaxID=1681184 RepID=UPI0006CE67C2|nr:tail fiber protein [Lysinibacillus sp. ZYM-1]KPN97669.1 phage tail protein [Lysinibacillus sp. ZYM-1]
MDPYLGEIRIFAGNYAPRDWAFCDGSQLPVAQYSALFAILGTTYGGDGRTTFNLPDLRGRAPMHFGNGPDLTPRTIAQSIGSSTVTLNETQMPIHTHRAQGSSLVAGGIENPTNAIWGSELAISSKPYVGLKNAVAMKADIVKSIGGNQPHNNMQPFVALNFIICLEGIFPPKP